MSSIKTLIDAYIKRNANQEITGPVLNGVLTAIADALGTPFIGEDGYWYEYDQETGEYVSSGTPAQGESGVNDAWAAVGVSPDPQPLPSVEVTYSPTLRQLGFTFYDIQGPKGDQGTPGITGASVSVDANVGTPSVDASIVNSILTLAFHNLRGAAAGFGTPTISVGANQGTPSASVTASGPDTAKVFNFAFDGLKGETGPQGPQGPQGNPGSSQDYPFTLANNLTTDDPTVALTAAMGVQLEGEVSQLSQEVTPIINAVDALNWKNIFVFDKTKPSYASLTTPIVLSQPGDSIELYVTNVPSTQNMNAGGYAFAGKNGSTRGNIALSYTGSVWVRSDDDTWILQYGNGVTGSTRRVKIVYNTASIDFYVDGALVSTYNSLKSITIYNFGNANNSSSYGYWSGKLEELKVNGAELNLADIATLTKVEDLSNRSFLAPSDLVDNLESDATNKALTAKQGKVLREMVENAGGSIYDGPISALGGWKYTFNGTSSKVSLNDPIILENDGDYIEVGIDNIQSLTLNDGGYGFCVNGTNIRIGLSTGSLYVRADDDTWLFQYSQGINANTIRLSYASGNVSLLFDGETVATYSGQKKMTIGGFGYGSSTYGYWKGAVNYIEANGVRIDLMDQNETDLTFSRTNGFLTNEQAALIASEAGKEMYVSKTAGQIDIYQRLPNGNYIHFPFWKRYKAYTAQEYPSYYDNWGIGALALASFSGSMSDVASLFEPGEAEMAVSVPSGQDNETNTYVGGQAHGFENIITGDNGRELCILVDNQKIAEDSVVALSPASKVEVIQHTNVCQAYTNSNPFAEVTKHWIWEGGKMSCTTSLKVLRSIFFRYAQFGMFCVYRRWLGNVSNNYLTNAAIKNNAPYKVWNIEDGWSGMLQSPDKDCTRIVEYGERGLGFAMSIKSETTQENGGMFVATNGMAYNKIYFDMGRSFTPSVNDVLEATQTWEIF